MDESTLNTSFCDAETQTEITGEKIDRMQVEIKEVCEEKEELEKEIEKLKELRLITENQKFDITKFKEKDEDIEFYTGLPHWDALMLLYNMVSDKAQNHLNYGSYEKKATDVEQKLKRPRAMSTFQEFILTLMRLRLGWEVLFECFSIYFFYKSQPCFNSCQMDPTVWVINLVMKATSNIVFYPGKQ